MNVIELLSEESINLKIFVSLSTMLMRPTDQEVLTIKCLVLSHFPLMHVFTTLYCSERT